MPIPRYSDPKTGTKFDISLVCPKCHWAIIKDRLTADWKECRQCGHKGLETKRYDY